MTVDRDRGILQRELEKVEKGFAQILMKIPPRNDHPLLPPYWLHLEMLERYYLLRDAVQSTSLLEVGCGPHAMATVPLAYMVGEKGHVCAVDRERWYYFEEIVKASSLRGRITPLWCDALYLPFRPASFDTAVIIHGIRSMRNEFIMKAIFREMLRVSSHLLVAETLPIAKTEAQKAHMEMYNLREEIFEAVTGRKDDIHYLPLERLTELVEGAGATVTEAATLEVKLPHYLAYIPREVIEEIKDDKKKAEILERWEAALENLQKYGEEHPPVGVVKAEPFHETHQ